MKARISTTALTISLAFVIVNTSCALIFENANAQQNLNQRSDNQPSSSTGSSTSSTRHFWVTFHNLRVYDNRDEDSRCQGVINCGAWRFTASVNEKQINLLENLELVSVLDNKNYSLGNQSIEVEVPENGTLRILTGGIEVDKVDIPDISNITKVLGALPVVGDAAAIADVARFNLATLAAQLQNDPIGIVAKDFDEGINDFGRGIHNDASCLKENIESLCKKDYELQYSIREFKPISKNSLTAEIFLYRNFTGPSAIITNNTASLGDLFSNDITSIKVYNDTNYRPGDYVQLCNEPYFSGECLRLDEPRNYDLQSMREYKNQSIAQFNHNISSIRFVRPSG
jgi:hypothetical protein